MIEPWILSKLNPLASNPVIILRDPQRMIVSGAHVVDGWAEKHAVFVNRKTDHFYHEKPSTRAD